MLSSTATRRLDWMLFSTVQSLFPTAASLIPVVMDTVFHQSNFVCSTWIPRKRSDEARGQIVISFNVRIGSEPGRCWSAYRRKCVSWLAQYVLYIVVFVSRRRYGWKYDRLCK